MKKILSILLACLCCLLPVAPVRADSARETYVRAYFVSLAAASCLGVYLPDNSTEFAYLRDYGWEIKPYREISGKTEANFAVGRNYFAQLDKELYLVAFRGSASKKDWNLNLRTAQVPFGGATPAEMAACAAKEPREDMPAVHAGFNTYVDAVLRSSVLDERGRLTGVFREVAENDKAFLLLTGHSLGGAAATLLGARLASMGLPKEKFAVITFGAPAVGNAAFAAAYAGQMDLLRVINKADPIPGSLQTFFAGYKQFGDNYKYNISTQISSFQHDMAMYFDYSIAEYYRAADAAAAEGMDVLPPARKITDNAAPVALWVYGSGDRQEEGMPAVRRLITDCYKSVLPSYIVMPQESGQEAFGAVKREDLLRLSRQAGAKYMLLCRADVARLRGTTEFYISMEQSLFSIEGRMLGMAAFSRRSGAAFGNVQAVGEVFLQAREILQQQLPLLSRYEEPPLPFFDGGVEL